MVNLIQEIENLYDDQTKKELNRWTLVNYQNTNTFLDTVNNPPGTSYTTRYTEDLTFPKAALDLQQKIIDILGIKDYKLRFGHGIINTVNYPGCEVWEHVDSLIIPGYITYHCNIVTKKPKGGETVINGQVYDIEENNGLCYAVSELRHKVNLITGTKLRILWTFAFHIPENQVNSILYDRV